MTTAFMFPGQGSQSVGMGKALAERFPEARAVFDEVDAALGEPLSGLAFEGPETALTLTTNAQPALMATSLAVFRVLQAHAGLDLAHDAGFVAGHSLGEYSALAAADALSVFDAARLLRLRGQAMQYAVAAGVGAMAALLGTDAEQAQQIAAEAAKDQICDVANDNGGGQVVLSGHAEAIARAIDLAKARGVKRAVLLNVSAPFHCGLMQPAAEAMQAALQSVDLRTPVVPLVANLGAAPICDAGAIRASLVAQISGTVRWRECVLAMAEAGVDDFVELGSGNVLCGLVKRIKTGVRMRAVGTPADVDAYVAAPSQGLEA
jgi:[acyl-carrier-protein] S-malonyltransferase